MHRLLQEGIKYTGNEFQNLLTESSVCDVPIEFLGK